MMYVLGTTCRPGMQPPDNHDEYDDDHDDNEYDQWDCFLELPAALACNTPIIVLHHHDDNEYEDEYEDASWNYLPAALACNRQASVVHHHWNWR